MEYKSHWEHWQAVMRVKVRILDAEIHFPGVETLQHTAVQILYKHLN